MKAAKNNQRLKNQTVSHNSWRMKPIVIFTENLNGGKRCYRKGNKRLTREGLFRVHNDIVAANIVAMEQSKN